MTIDLSKLRAAISVIDDDIINFTQGDYPYAVFWLKVKNLKKAERFPVINFIVAAFNEKVERERGL